MTVQPYVYIEPPDVQPHRYGLFGAAQPLTIDRPEWQYGGVEFESLACYPAGFYPLGVGLDDGAGGGKTLPVGTGTTKALPFAVYAGVECGSVGYTWDEFVARSLRVLELTAQQSAESALWTGAGGESPHLNATGYAHEVNGTTAVDVVTGLAMLEDYIGGAYNGAAVIHATRGTGIHLAAQHLVRHDDSTPIDLLMTPLGTRYVFGTGYDGTGPDAAAPGTEQAWMYATGQVGIERSQPFSPGTDQAPFQIMDRAHNLVDVYAEQTYIITVDCAVAAVLVDFTL